MCCYSYFSTITCHISTLSDKFCFSNQMVIFNTLTDFQNTWTILQIFLSTLSMQSPFRIINLQKYTKDASSDLQKLTIQGHIVSLLVAHVVLVYFILISLALYCIVLYCCFCIHMLLFCQISSDFSVFSSFSYCKGHDTFSTVIQQTKKMTIITLQVYL